MSDIIWPCGLSYDPKAGINMRYFARDPFRYLLNFVQSRADSFRIFRVLVSQWFGLCR